VGRKRSKFRFRIAGEVLVIATLADSATAQSPRTPINVGAPLTMRFVDDRERPPE
jgi:hypothetical protein